MGTESPFARPSEREATEIQPAERQPVPVRPSLERPSYGETDLDIPSFLRRKNDWADAGLPPAREPGRRAGARFVDVGEWRS